MARGFRIKRVYEAPSLIDGERVLVDRLWPRGLSKEVAHVDRWMKELAPSTRLRKWFAHDPAKWDEFRRRYAAELDAQAEAVAELRKLARKGPVTILFGAKDAIHSNAAALLEYLKG